jgi:glycosyltransferase involved in cell wall biosynthesis
MRVVHITVTDDLDGAGIAARRVHEAQLMDGIDSHMIVYKKNTKSNNIIEIKKLYTFDKILNYIFSVLGFKNWFTFNTFFVRINKIFKSADIIHIHNIQYSNFFSPLFLPKSKKIIWTLHDMWALTGFCNYTYQSCEKFYNGCGKCPVNHGLLDYLKQFIGCSKKKNYFKEFLIPDIHLFFDTTKILWNLKKQIVNNLEITFIAPSKWIGKQAQLSGISSNSNIRTIPNMIDTEKFNVSIKKQSNNKFKLLFVGQATQSNDRKGFFYFISMLNYLDSKLFEIIIVGKVHQSNKVVMNELGFTYNCIDPIYDINKMIAVYQRSHIIIIPSIVDNLPNIAFESIACGTPVVAFNVGGIPDLVNDKNGYLAIPLDVKDLASGVCKIVKNYDNYSNNAREHALQISNNTHNELLSIYGL